LSNPQENLYQREPSENVRTKDMNRRVGECCSFRLVFSFFGALCWGLLFSLTTSMPASAQFNSSIEGTVIDASGAVVADVNIRVINDSTGLEFATKTSTNGYYRVPTLPVGQYRVEASKEGFDTAVQSGVILEVAKVQAVPLQLRVGQVTTKVNVTEAPPIVGDFRGCYFRTHHGPAGAGAALGWPQCTQRDRANAWSDRQRLVSDRAGANDIFNAANAPSLRQWPARIVQRLLYR